MSYFANLHNETLKRSAFSFLCGGNVILLFMPLDVYFRVGFQIVVSETHRSVDELVEPQLSGDFVRSQRLSRQFHGLVFLHCGASCELCTQNLHCLFLVKRPLMAKDLTDTLETIFRHGAAHTQAERTLQILPHPREMRLCRQSLAPVVWLVSLRWDESLPH